MLSPASGSMAFSACDLGTYGSILGDRSARDAISVGASSTSVTLTVTSAGATTCVLVFRSQ